MKKAIDYQCLTEGEKGTVFKLDDYYSTIVAYPAEVKYSRTLVAGYK